MKYKYSIVICGKISSGKTALIKYLANEFDIPVTSFGKMIKDKVEDINKNPTRKQLQDFGYNLFSSIGAKKILEMAIDHSNNNNTPIIIFDGVRHETVLKEIKNISQKTLLIFLDAKEDLRFSRFMKYTGSDNMSSQDFHKMDNHDIERGIDKLKEDSDLIMDASKPLEKVCSISKNEIQKFISI